MNLMGQLKSVDESTLAKSDRVEPLFNNQAELDEFRARHSQHTVPQADITTYSGPCYLGIDAGSTTIKAVVLSEDMKILYSHYQNNEGSPLAAAKKIVAEVYRRLPERPASRATANRCSKKRCTSTWAKSKPLPTIRQRPTSARTSTSSSISAART